MSERKVLEEGTLCSYGGPPEWWHMHGSKLEPVIIQKGLILDASAAELRITPRGSKGNRFDLKWILLHTYGKDNGLRTIDRSMLVRAFGINGTLDDGKIHMEQGVFTRWNHYLIFPSPGNSCDGDPNISVDVTPEIQEAVTDLITRRTGR